MRRLILSMLMVAPFLLSSGLKNIPHCKLKHETFKYLTDIPRPSDIVWDKDSKQIFITSSEGKLFECDAAGNFIRKAKDGGMDFEGVEVTDSFVYVIDAKTRDLYKYSKSDLSLIRTFTSTSMGTVNKSFESVIYNPVKKCFVLVSQSPASIIEYGNDFRETDRHKFPAARDISGARWHDGFIYLLSNLDETIFKCDPLTYEVKEYYKIDVLNPSGITFDGDGNILITSADLQRLYTFKNIPTIKQ